MQTSIGLERRIEEKEIECFDLRKSMKHVQGEFERRIDYGQFERICDELQRALNREKQAQDLLNEQNNQLKSLTDILHQTQQEKDHLQEKIQQIIQNDKYFPRNYSLMIYLLCKIHNIL